MKSPHIRVGLFHWSPETREPDCRLAAGSLERKHAQELAPSMLERKSAATPVSPPRKKSSLVLGFFRGLLYYSAINSAGIY